MRAREVECFRPLLLAQQWDYIVVWKLGDDPSRYDNNQFQLTPRSSFHSLSLSLLNFCLFFFNRFVGSLNGWAVVVVEVMSVEMRKEREEKITI